MYFFADEGETIPASPAPGLRRRMIRETQGMEVTE